MTKATTELDKLERDLRSAFKTAELPGAPAHLRAEVQAVSAELMRPASQRRWKPGRRLVVGFVGLAAVIALVAVAVPFWRAPNAAPSPTPSESAPTASPSASPSLAPSPTLWPTPVMPTSTESPWPSFTATPRRAYKTGPSVVWSEVPLDGFAPSYLGTNSVAQLNGTTFVAGVEGAHPNDRAVVVESSNGVDWTRMPFDGEIGGDPRLVAIPSGLLLVGWADGDPDCDAILRKVCLRMWHTSDGRSWQAIPSDQMQQFDRVIIHSIVSGPNGYVAVGTRVNPSYPRYDEAWTEGVAFHSFDGLTWTRAVFRDGSKVGDATGMRPYPVVATASGYVALHDQEDGYSPAIWLSADGLTWDRSSAAMPFECSPELVAGSSGILAYCLGGSSDGSGKPLPVGGPWISANGTTWRKAPPDCPYWDNQSWVAGDGSRIVVITGDSVYWSNDAKTWTRGTSSPVPSGSAHDAGPLDASLSGSTVVMLTRGPIGPALVGIYVGHVADK